MSESPSIALVTGGNRGIGLAIAQRLKEAGHRVVITYRSGIPPEGFDAVVMDVTSSQSVETAFATIESEIGQPEIIVANAGITKDKGDGSMASILFKERYVLKPTQWYESN